MPTKRPHCVSTQVSTNKIRKVKNIIALIFLLLIVFQGGNSQTLTRDQIIHLGEVNGFLYGQKMSLERIKQNFPDLRNNVLEVELKWKLEFGKVEDEVQRQLKEILKDKYDESIKLIKEKLEQSDFFKNFTRIDAVNFIETVNQRAKGNIEEQFKAKVLMYNPDFIKYPSQEFSRGYRNKYLSTGNEIKSKGIKIKFEFPVTWLQKEGERPNILFKTISQNGDGPTSLVINIRDFKKELDGQLSKEELNQFFSQEGNRKFADMALDEKSVKEMFTDSGIKNLKFSEYKRVEIDGNPAAKINISGIKTRLEFEIPLEMSNYLIICKNFIVDATFSSSGVSQEEAKSEFNKNKLLFNLIMNTLIILNKYD